MIVVIGRVRSDAAKRDQLLQVAHAITTASREEDGCLGYRFYQDTEAKDDFVFVEEWADMAALRQHFSTAHVADFMRSIRGVIAAPPDVRFHEVASSMDLDQVTAGG